MKTSLVLTALVALAIPIGSATTASAEKLPKVEICHFRGHVDPSDPSQPDFILDLELPYEERVAECIDLGGHVLRVNANAVSYIDDDVRRGHEVDVP